MKSVLSFIAGVGIGVAISWSYHKHKVEEQINDEFREAREYRKQQENMIKKVEEKEELHNEVEQVCDREIELAKNIINYNKYSSRDVDSHKVTDNKRHIFVITPEEFASQEGYDTDTFYIYEDDVITNDNDELINDVVGTFGLTTNEIRKQFSIYSDDSVYIRNDILKIDYEILRDIGIYEKRDGE